MTPASAEETIQRLILSLSELEQLSASIISGRGNFSVSSQMHLRVIMNTLQVTQGAILRFHPTQRQLVIESTINVKDESLMISVELDTIPLMLQFPIIDLSRPPLALEPFLSGIQPQLQSLGANLWAVLKVQDEFLGIISLGPFLAGIEMEDWSHGLFRVLANQTAISMVHSRLLDEVRADKFHLFLLSDMTAQICQRLDTGILAEEVVDDAVTLLDAGAGCLMLIDPLTQQLEMKSHFALDGILTEPPPQKQGGEWARERVGEGLEHASTRSLLSLLNDVTTGGKTLVCNDEETAALFGRTNLIAVPIFGREILGVLVVCDKKRKSGTILNFTSEDGLLLEAFAHQVGVAMENAQLYQEALERRRLQAEMDEAAKIQAKLLPEGPPGMPGYEVAALSIPRGGVGGDYFDYIREPNGAWGFAIADVSGKGMQAALLMATLRAGLRSEVSRRKDLPSMAMELNSFLCESSTKDAYATLFYAQLQPETGVLTSINAGHNYPLVVRQDGSSKWLEKGGLVLGMYPDDMLKQIWEYEQETTQLYCGDTVLFYTDGVTETLDINDEMYGEERLAENANRLRHATANEICTAIYTSVLDFQGEAQQFDDLTLIVLKRK
jgi:sigma-B regulation protein RsbU (phosphoserine phosphatase)